MQANISGALKSPDDPRDWVFENLDCGSVSERDDLPEEFDLREYSQPVRDQCDRATCAAFTIAGIKEIQSSRSKEANCWMSPEFIYYHRDNKPARGMYGRNVFQILQRIGTVPEHLYPYRE